MSRKTGTELNPAILLIGVLTMLLVFAGLTGFRRNICLICMLVATGISAVFGISYLVGAGRVEDWDPRPVPSGIKCGFALAQGVLLLCNAAFGPAQTALKLFPEWSDAMPFLTQTVGVALGIGLGAIPGAFAKKQM